jgi:phosphoserine phosphatase
LRDRVLAIYDLGHTILKGDSPLLFGRFLTTKGRVNLKVVPPFVNAVAQFYLRNLEIGELKAAYLRLFCHGLSRTEIEYLVKEFTATVLFPNIYKEPRAHIEWHQTRNTRLLCYRHRRLFIRKSWRKRWNLFGSLKTFANLWRN